MSDKLKERIQTLAVYLCDPVRATEMGAPFFSSIEGDVQRYLREWREPHDQCLHFIICCWRSESMLIESDATEVYHPDDQSPSLRKLVFKSKREYFDFMMSRIDEYLARFTKVMGAVKGSPQLPPMFQ